MHFKENGIFSYSAMFGSLMEYDHQPSISWNIIQLHLFLLTDSAAFLIAAALTDCCGG